ncbi:MAG: hypothetical protein ABEJ66_02270, partial [Candidatus Nanohaloarchaea archaeon]
MHDTTARDSYALARWQNLMASSSDTGELRYPEEVLEAEEFVDGEVIDGPLNQLLDPGMAVTGSRLEEDLGPAETGYDEELGYDRLVLEQLCELARDIEDGFGPHSE